MNPKVGVVTVTFNSQAVIEEFLDSLFKQDYKNFHLYVVDNDSKDESINLITKLSDARITLVINGKNLGIAAANNIGILKAIEDGCENILLINNDTEFENTLLSKLVNVQLLFNCSLVAPKIMYFNNSDRIWFAGGSLSKYRGYMPSHWGIDEIDIGQYSDIKEITYAPTCCVLLNSEVIIDVGLMDERYFVYYDDTDYMYRVLMNNKHRMMYLGDVQFYHKVGSLSKSSEYKKLKKVFSAFYIEYTTRNLVYYLKKQRTLPSKFFIFYYYLRINLKFLVSAKYNKNFETFLLIQKAFIRGLML